MASSKSLQQAIANIKIWHKGEQRAPHKPLLLLYVLAGYLNGHPRLFDYGSEIYEPLHSLLERFGPQRSHYRPDMPFWRLQGDGLTVDASMRADASASFTPAQHKVFLARLNRLNEKGVC